MLLTTGVGWPMDAVHSLDTALAALGTSCVQPGSLALELRQEAGVTRLHATLDVGSEVHLERRPCVLDPLLENVVMTLPEGLALEVRNTQGTLVASELTVADVPLDIELAAPNGELFVVVCDVHAHRLASAAATTRLATAAAHLAAAPMGAGVCVAPEGQRPVSLAAAEHHIAQLDLMTQAVLRLAGVGMPAPGDEAGAFDAFGGRDNFVFPASHMPARVDSGRLRTLLDKLGAF